MPALPRLGTCCGASSVKKLLLATGILTIALGFAYHVAGHPMDFRVYHYGARGVFEGTRPVYGPASGLGWPMHYRYPPLFLFLFAPLAALPLSWSAALWVLLKLAVFLWLIREFWKRRQLWGGILPPAQNFFVPVLFLLPYLIEDFRYGNVQFFIFALVAASLLLARERPALWAGSLALAISIKVWPLFFVPFLAVRRNWKILTYVVSLVVLLALVPSIYFGVAGNFQLLTQWFQQERHTQLSENEIWFPNQSLRGVLMRYLTVVDYTGLPDSNYPQINIATIDPTNVRLFWFIIAGAIYTIFLFFAYRRRDSEEWLDYSLAFCLLALLEPFTQKYALVVLVWPAMTAASMMKEARLRILIYSATVLVLIQPLAVGASAQRFLQVLGTDFAATTLLTIAITLSDESSGIL